MATTPYPRWQHYPRNTAPEGWVEDLVAVFAAVESQISTQAGNTLKSDDTLAALAPGLKALGYAAEEGKEKAQKLSRPVLYGEGGKVERRFDVDAVHDPLGIIVEVEAGRAWANNAATYDLWKACMILSAKHLVLVVPISYSPGGATGPYAQVKGFLDTLYTSRRIQLPLESVILIGY